MDRVEKSALVCRPCSTQDKRYASVMCNALSPIASISSKHLKHLN